MVEFVGWTVFDGLETPPGTMMAPQSAAGETIINAKFGLRWSNSLSSVYLGYGRALTGDVWYEDIVRAEYELRF